MSATVFFSSGSELATLTNTFTVNGVATDPTTISLAVTTPSGVTTTYTYAGATITRTSTGLYTKDVACSEAGLWQYVWTGTGTAADVTAGTWQVFLSPLAAGVYCSKEQVKSRFAITDSNDDFEIERAIRAASRRVDSYTGRERFWCDPTPTVRVFEVRGAHPRVWISEGISTTTGLVVLADLTASGSFGTTLTLGTDFQLKPFNAPSKYPAWPYDELEIISSSLGSMVNGRPAVQITARFGWPAIPDDVSEATLILAHRLFKRKETSSGVVGFDGTGTTVRLARTDPDVAELLESYRLSTGFA